jgi:RNA polymerase sigma-70 factor, ECF subfamily
VADDRAPTDLQPTPEQALVAAAATDPAAFARLFDLHFPRVYGYLARRVEDREAAEELATIAFTRGLAVLRAGGLGEATFGGFVHLVAATALVDRAERRRQSIPAGARARDFRPAGYAGADAAGDEPAARVLAAAVDRETLRRSLQRLSESQLRIVLLTYLDGLEPDEVSTVVGASRQEVAVELHRALRTLRGMANQDAIDAA